ncbi:SMI1/KNR4 family protein [Streptomyces capoamus]|uniref:SMI1/KNR4 family protein n=1 Tax=Streptomyces capoamus TaxID=68183 RepID=UPI003391F869
MSEDEIVERVRAFAGTHRLPPPAPAEAVAELEALVGWPMPTLLRRLYLEVADGGFGPSFHVLSLTDTGRWFSDEESLLQLARDFGSAEPEPTQPPRHTVPLMTLGCAVWWFIDFSTAEGRMWGWEPNARCERHCFFPERFTLAQWLTDWLDGNRTFPEPPPLTDCPDCR